MAQRPLVPLAPQQVNVNRSYAPMMSGAWEAGLFGTKCGEVSKRLVVWSRVDFVK
jgi:hypothetical protein